MTNDTLMGTLNPIINHSLAHSLTHSVTHSVFVVGFSEISRYWFGIFRYFTLLRADPKNLLPSQCADFDRR